MTDWRLRRIGATSLALALLLRADAATGQQTGGIEGAVTLHGAASPDGIGVLAETGAVPRPRSTVTDASGHYALPRLYPGPYRVTFTTPAGASRTVEVQVLLGQTTTLNLDLEAAAAAVSEELVVIGERVAVRGRAAVASAIDGEAVRDMPLGPDYRSLVRLAPGVQVTQDIVRGPASGGSGQDNVYRFDGVDVSLPMFGTLSAELSSHDVDQVTFERAGATAVGFNRSGGFTMDSTARSGTNAFSGSVEYTVEPPDLLAEPETVLESVAGHDTDRQRAAATLGGPIPEARETLSRESNGWGAIETPGGVDLAEDGTPVFYVATVQQMSALRPDGTVVSPIDSFTETTSLEVHDRLTTGDFTFDAGVLLSEDNYARYHPEATSLARAASWDRNTRASLRVLFDEGGRIISHEPYPGSSGKLFQDGMKPRRIDELTLGRAT